MYWKYAIAIVSVIVVSLCVLLQTPGDIHDPEYFTPVIAEAQVLEKAQVLKIEKPITLFFTGDIMLGRDVETHMNSFGLEYPFQNVSNLLKSYDITIGNFEGVVSEEHIQTPSMTFRFSIKEEHLQQVQIEGFDIVSLANNHSFDYGTPALAYTRTLCAKYGIICAGTPSQIDEYSLVIKKIGTKKIGIIFIQIVTAALDTDRLEEVLDALASQTDYQYAYVHWGDEYILVHNDAQEVLAKTLIDNGIDAVIGHHPHVVQDISFYKDKPIFYSLGNFIFDQYFSDDVQEGLGVSLSIFDTYTEYSLVPFTSNGTHGQPRQMTVIEQNPLFSRILDGVQDYEGVQVNNGVIMVQNSI